MKTGKTLHIKNWKRLFRCGLYWILNCQIYTPSSSHKNKCFLKKIEIIQGFFVAMTMSSFKQVEPNYSKKESYERGCG